MKVIHLITTLDRGGAENQLKVLVAAQILSGKKVSIIYLKGSGALVNEFEQLGAEVLKEVANKNIVIQIYLLRKQLAQYPKALLHSHLPRAEVLAFLSHSKIVKLSSRHNAEPFFPNAPKWLSRFLAVGVTKKSKYLIAISEAVKLDIQERREISKKTEVITVLYGFANDQNPVCLSKSDILMKLGLYDEKIKLIFAANRLTSQKDIPTMLNGFSVFLKKEPSAALMIAGEGVLEKQLRETSSRLGINNNVFWLGKVDNINDYLKACDLFVLTSEYEGFGMVLLESIWAGIPVVATNSSAIPEVLGNEYPGLFELKNASDLADKFELLLNDHEVREIARKQLEGRKKLFDPAVMEDSISEIYDWVLL